MKTVPMFLPLLLRHEVEILSNVKHFLLECPDLDTQKVPITWIFNKDRGRMEY